MNYDILKSNLLAIGFPSKFFKTKEAAAEYLLDTIKGSTVGIGGSITVKELDIYNKLTKENTVFWHWMPIEGKSTSEMLKLASETEVYISSANAISENGEIVNIDGTCNRVASISFGHKKVYIVIGKNKIMPDLESAISRARNVAAPKNARRLNKKTPCAVGELKCHNCKSKEKICRNLSVLWKAPEASSYEIIIVDEELGY